MYRSYWDGLGAQERHDMEWAGSLLTARPGQVIHPPGVDPDWVFIVRSGIVKVIAGAGPHAVILAIRGIGDIIGEIGFVLRDPGSAAMIAVTDATVLKLAHDAFAAVLALHPTAADGVHRTIASRLREADRDRIAVASMNVGQQLARLLLKIVQRSGTLVISGLSQSELAECIGSAPRTVTRVVGKWRSRGIVTTNRRTMVVHKLDELRRIAGPHAPNP